MRPALGMPQGVRFGAPSAHGQRTRTQSYPMAGTSHAGVLVSQPNATH